MNMIWIAGALYVACGIVAGLMVDISRPSSDPFKDAMFWPVLLVVTFVRWSRDLINDK